MTYLPLITSALVTVAIVAAASVALALGHIDGSTFSAIVAGFGGAGVGTAAHAAGVASKP